MGYLPLFKEICAKLENFEKGIRNYEGGMAYFKRNQTGILQNSAKYNQPKLSNI